ncbi:7713_t:CDS:2 [Entrophospora sp. SA101]|nr:7713_t:CDS:2 [Entrophospora sp. SA101]
MSRGVDCDSHQYFPLPTLSTSITRPQSTSSIDEIRKKFTEIETENNEIKKKYVEVEAENTDLKEIIKENARREAESMKLKARVEELERYKKENEKRFEKLEEKQLKNVNNFENIANVSDSDTYASNIKSSVPSDQKKEQGLIQEISIKDQNNITEISSNNIPQNHVPEIDYSTSDKDIIYDLPGEAKLRVSNSTEVSNTSILSNSETIPVSTEIQASVFDDSSDSNLNPLENRLITTYNIGIELDKFI